jgi:hypothetical protein
MIRTKGLFEENIYVRCMWDLSHSNIKLHQLSEKKNKNYMYYLGWTLDNYSIIY